MDSDFVNALAKATVALGLLCGLFVGFVYLVG